MKQIKVNTLTLTGAVNCKLEEGWNIIFAEPIKINGGKVTKIDGDNVTITYNTQKENLYGHDITPRINFGTNDDIEFDMSLETQDIELRAPNDAEYNALNEFLKNDYCQVDEDGFTYKDIIRNRLMVYEINENFKILNISECTIFKSFSGKSSVTWDTFRYALKYGNIYPYNEETTSDECQEDISGLMDILK